MQKCARTPPENEPDPIRLVGIHIPTVSNLCPSVITAGESFALGVPGFSDEQPEPNHLRSTAVTGPDRDERAPDWRPN
jgi:hypothetical protein